VFIVGAPRCGTTTLSHFLKGHPSICFPLVKEPHFFAQHDLRGLSDEKLKKKVEREYLGHFFRHEPGRSVGADASVTYLYRPELLEPVLRLWPDSRFIIALRDPLTMLPSLHRRLVYIGDETIGSFDKAWAAVSDRAAGRRIPSRCADPRFLRYDEAARFGTYIERLFAVVGRERCLVVIFDDLVSDPGGQYRRVLDFCGLEPVPRSEFPAHRAGSSVRLRWLQRLLKRPPKALRNQLAGELFVMRTSKPGETPKRRALSAVLALRERLLKWNRKALPPEPLEPHLQEELRGHLKDEIDRLSNLLGRDLTHWLQADEQRRA
jgi:hypothetical protein